jgi:hypothetical protein
VYSGRSTDEPSPPTAPDPAPPTTPAPSRGGGTGAMKSSLSTYFAGCGVPFCGCGIMPDKLVDDNGKPLPFVALNGVKADGSDAARHKTWEFPIPGNMASEFKNGANCGRWVEIEIGKNCVGGSNTDDDVCIGGCAPLPPPYCLPHSRRLIGRGATP